MPNKTIYVRDADLPLFEQVQDHLGVSVSSMFAKFLRERVAKVLPEEQMIIRTVNEIERQREALKLDNGLPGHFDGDNLYAEVIEYAKKSLASLQAGDVENAMVLWCATTTYHRWADQEVENARDLFKELGRLLKAYPMVEARDLS